MRALPFLVTGRVSSFGRIGEVPTRGGVRMRSGALGAKIRWRRYHGIPAPVREGLFPGGKTRRGPIALEQGRPAPVSAASFEAYPGKEVMYPI